MDPTELRRISVTGLLASTLGVACARESPPASESYRKPPLSEPLKIATVDMNQVFAGFYKTKDKERRINALKAISKQELDERNAYYRDLIAEYQALRSAIDNPQTSEELRVEKQEQAKAIATKARRVEREKKEYSEERLAELLAEVDRARVSVIDEIQDRVTTTAQMWNYDMVFDRSSIGETGTSTVLYVKHEIDISDDVLSSLNLENR